MGRHVPLREDHGLAAQGAGLGPADIEHVTQPGDVLKGQVRVPAHQAVGQPGAVQEQPQAVFPADRRDPLQLRFRIQRAVFRRVGNIYHAGKGHVLVALVRVVSSEVSAQRFRLDLPVRLLHLQHLPRKKSC